ncbi:MAG: XRE family transcriptional regulator, partial [Caulobacteraceae bacterium]|nr:XRE family transcriptional regulator [Caulobacteraceae bacterium]
MNNPLKSYLSARGITAVAFAERIDVSPAYLSRLMSGEREADATFLGKVFRETDGVVTPTEWVGWFDTLRDPVSG